MDYWHVSSHLRRALRKQGYTVSRGATASDAEYQLLERIADGRAVVWASGEITGAIAEEYDTRSGGGYRTIKVRVDGRQRRCYSHRVVALVHGHTLGPDLEVHHKNGVRDDNRPENLAVVTPEEHRKMHGKRRWDNG